MKRICFVCLGNICRSPMAEAVCAHILAERGLDWHVDSSGTAAYHIGDAPDPRTVAVCRKHNIAIDHQGRQAISADFEKFDYVLAMDEENLTNLQKLKGSENCNLLALLGDYDPRGEREVGDPYYGGADGFDRVFAHVYRSIVAFLDSVGE